MKDAKWGTESTKFGFYVKGIYPPGVDGTHVNGVDLSPSRQLLITGDDWGLVNIYRYPVSPKSKALSLRGHSEFVVRVKFSPNEDYIYSIGGQDKAVIIWKKE